MRPCTICEHPERARIEDGRLRKIARHKLATEFTVSEWAIARHDQHLGRSVACTGERPLLDRIETLMTRLEKIAQQAEGSKDWKAAIAAMREVRESLELLAKLSGQMPSPGRPVTVGVAVNISNDHSRNDASNHDLNREIAASVSEATDGFDPRVIESMRRLLQRSAPLEIRQLAATSVEDERAGLLE